MSPSLLLSVGRWLAVLVPAAGIALVLTGVLDVRTGIVVGVVLELLLLVVVLAEVRVARQAYRRSRAHGADRRTAAVDGLRAAFPPVVVRLAQAEIGLWRTLCWAVRGRADVRPGDTPIRYADRFGVVLWGLTALGLVELLVVHLLLPWPVAGWALFVLGVYALVWFVAFVLSMRQHPHVVREGELVLRFGHFRSVPVPLDGLAGVRTGAVSDHKRTLVVDDGQLALSVMGDTNVELRFDPPVDVDARGVPMTVDRVLFWADDPRTTTAFLRERRTAAG